MIQTRRPVQGKVTSKHFRLPVGEGHVQEFSLASHFYQVAGCFEKQKASPL